MRTVVDTREERGDLGPVEAIEVDPVDVVPAFEPGEHVAAGEPATQFLGAVGADEEVPRGAQPGQTLEHLHAAGIGPVQVLEHHDRGSRTGRRKHRGDGVDRRVDRRAAEEVVHDTERLGDARRLGLPGPHRPRRRAHQLSQQPGLADAGFAAHQRQGKIGRGRQPPQPTERGLPPDHHRTETQAATEHAQPPSDTLIGQHATGGDQSLLRGLR